MRLGTRESSPLMAEELTFEQIKGNGGTVELDQRLSAAMTGIVDCVSDEFFPCSGFSLNEYCGIPSCNALRLFQNNSQSWTIANDLLESAGPTVLINHFHQFNRQSPRAFAS
jgi:hypothetical protein